MENRLLKDADAAKLNPVNLRAEIAGKEKKRFRELEGTATACYAELAQGLSDCLIFFLFVNFKSNACHQGVPHGFNQAICWSSSIFSAVEKEAVQVMQI